MARTDITTSSGMSVKVVITVGISGIVVAVVTGSIVTAVVTAATVTAVVISGTVTAVVIMPTMLTCSIMLPTRAATVAILWECSRDIGANKSGGIAAPAGRRDDAVFCGSPTVQT